MIIRRRPFKSVDDLEQKVQRAISKNRISLNRANVPIVVIDDQEFAPLVTLRKNGYNIAYMSDIPNMSALTNYSIILCDLRGVGTEMNPTLQGAHIIKQIKQEFPEKIVIAYTGGGDRRMLAYAISVADHYTEKDTPIESWCDLLDSAIKDLANPAYVWRRLRVRFLSAGVTPYDLAVLEDLFVRSFEKGPDEFKKALAPDSLSVSLPGPAVQYYRIVNWECHLRSIAWLPLNKMIEEFLLESLPFPWRLFSKDGALRAFGAGALFPAPSQLNTPAHIAFCKAAPFGWSACPAGYAVYKTHLSIEQQDYLTIYGLKVKGVSTQRGRSEALSLFAQRHEVETFVKRVMQAIRHSDDFIGKIVGRNIHEVRAINSGIYNAAYRMEASLEKDDKSENLYDLAKNVVALSPRETPPRRL